MHPRRARPRLRQLSDFEEGLLSDLFAVVEEHADEAAVAVDRDRVREAFVYACRAPRRSAPPLG